MVDEYQITDESTVTFHDLFREKEEDGLNLVGRQDIGSYVSIPVEAVEIIDLLDSGKTVSDVKRILEEKYGGEVEIEEFIEDMITNEMVKSVDGYEIATTSQAQKDLFSMVTGRHVGWMFSRYARIVYLGIAVSCLTIFFLISCGPKNVESFFSGYPLSVFLVFPEFSEKIQILIKIKDITCVNYFMIFYDIYFHE